MRVGTEIAGDGVGAARVVSHHRILPKRYAARAARRIEPAKIDRPRLIRIARDQRGSYVISKTNGSVCVGEPAVPIPLKFSTSLMSDAAASGSGGLVPPPPWPA